MPSPSNLRLASAETVIRECFWGDYLLTPTNLLRKLDSGDPGFERFLFSKIIENSLHPSRHLRTLFAPRITNELLTRHLTQSGDKPRVRLIAANLTGKYDLVPELQWNR